MTEIRKRLRNKHLRRSVACHRYRVDPENVAEALIMRLVRDAHGSWPTADGPSHADPGAYLLRRAA
jgi:hypothetical protein